MKKLIAGNWKMTGSVDAAGNLATSIAQMISTDTSVLDRCDFLVCPPYVHLHTVLNAVKESGASISVGAQDCTASDNGAYTGDISAEMIKDMGCSHVILGHSERRQYHDETDKVICTKAKAVHKAGLIAIICVGETEKQRSAGLERDVVGAQLEVILSQGFNSENTVIAYEPVWAIGTGKTATADDVGVMHKFIREKLASRLANSENIRILYGGSMKPDNAEELLAVQNVDGGLIGGASLKADQYLAIAGAAKAKQSEAA